MDLQYLEKFCQKKGLEIAQVLLEGYDSADFEIGSPGIEKEIYEISTSYSRVLFFEAKKFLKETVRDEIKTHLASRFGDKQTQKMKGDVDLVAHWIKSEIIRTLEDKNVFLN